MAYSKDDVAAAAPLATGGVLYAPKGTALPTTATAALNVAFKPLGLVGEDGLTPSGEGASVTDLRDWSGDVVETVTENRSITRFDFTLLSIFDPDVAEFVYGADNVTATPATTAAGTKLAIQETGEEIADCVLVFDMIHKGKRMRIVAPDGAPSVTGELPFNRTALSGYTVTATCLPDETGVRTYRYYDNDDVTPADMVFEVPASKASIKQNRFEFRIGDATFDVPLMKYLPGSVVELIAEAEDKGGAAAVAAQYAIFGPPGSAVGDAVQSLDAEQLDALTTAYTEASGVTVGESSASTDS